MILASKCRSASHLLRTVIWIKAARKYSSTIHPAFSTQDFILKGKKHVNIPDIKLPEAIWSRLHKLEGKTAIVCNDTGRNYTYAQLHKRSVNFAKALRGCLKLRPGETVAVLLPNVPEFPIVILGTIEAGLVATTINPIYTQEEISKQLIDSNAKVLVTLCEYHERAQNAITKANISIPIISIKTKQGEPTPAGAINFGEFCERETDFDDLRQGSTDNVILMPYSSGTTGLPKGVELTHKTMVSNLFQTDDLQQVIRPTTKDSQDVVPAILPMFHVYGLSVNILKMLHLGAQIITVPKYTIESFIKMLEEKKPQHLILVPPIVIFLAANPSVTPTHLESVLSILSAAAPLGASDVERLFEKTKRDIINMQGYGMTETGSVVTLAPPEIWKNCIGSVGRALYNIEVKVITIDDPHGTPLGPNERGELLVRGPQVMPRYHNNPKATEEAFLDGWLRTGDMAYYDDQENIWITDRLKELIKVKGFQVAPAELEAIIRNHPAVADAAVIGVPHPISGEVPRAFVVPKANTKFDEEDLKQYVAKKVASYKRLEGGVKVLDAIPKNPSGKIMRRTLKIQYGEE